MGGCDAAETVEFGGTARTPGGEDGACARGSDEDFVTEIAADDAD